MPLETVLTDLDDNHHWNQREKKPPVLQFILLALFCAILAYVLSAAAD